MSLRRIFTHSRWRLETAKLPLEEFGKRDRSAIFEIRSYDLYADRQTGLRTIDRRHGRREPGGRGKLPPHNLCIEVGVRFAVDQDVSRLDRG